MANRARSLLVAGGVVALVVAAVGSLAAGAKSIPVGTVMRSLFDFDGSPDERIVRNLRLPRTCVAAVTGAALGAAGALTQAATRNPLADPGLLGVSAGASLAVVVSIVVFGVTSLAVSVWFALVGAGAAALLVFAIASGGRAATRPLQLVLTGLAVSALVASITSALVLQDRDTLDQFRFWAVGSVSGRDWTVLASVAPFIVVGLVVAMALSRPLDAVALGDEAAAALGTSVLVTNVAAGLAITLLAGAATAACGPIAFVGLTAAHAARLLWGPAHRWVLPGATLIGATVLTACDAAGRVLDRPTEIQAGIMTALIGGPVFVLLVRRMRTVPA